MNKVRRAKLSKIADQLEALVAELEAIQEEEEEYRDNIPENLQGGERYEAAENAIDQICEAIENIGFAFDNIQEVAQ